MALVLTEPFDNLTAWTLTNSIGSATITSGGVVGTFARMATGAQRGYPIPSPNQSADVDVTFWWRSNNVTAVNLSLFTIRSGSGIELMVVTMGTTGHLAIYRGPGTTKLGESTGAVAANTWYQLRLVVHMDASPNGTARLDLNGSTVVNVTGALTYQTTAVATSIWTDDVSGQTNDYDELVLNTGAGIVATGTGAIVFGGAGAATAGVVATGTGAIAFAGTGTAVVTFLGGAGAFTFDGRGTAKISPLIVVGVGHIDFAGRGDIDVEPRLDVYAPPEWSWLVLRPDGTPIGPLTAATARKLTLPLDGVGTASFTMPGDHSQTKTITELATDLYVARNGRALFRGRIGGSSETHAAASDSVTLTAIDYRGLLAHRLIWPSSKLKFDDVDQADIAWKLIADTQALGDLGITRGTGVVTGVVRDREFTAGIAIAQAIEGLAGVADGFDWEIDAHLAFNIFHPERGRYPADVPSSQPILTYGRDVVSVTTTVDPSKYANAIYFTGSQDDTDPATPVGTSDPDIGRWELQKADPTVTLQATVDEEAAAELADASQLPSAITVTLAADIWNPYFLWLGDLVRALITVGRLDLDVRRRIVQIDVTLDDTGVETVALAIGAAPPKLSDRLNNLQNQISQLQLAKGGGGDDTGIKEITSTGGTIAITAPTGPTTNLEVASGVGHITVTNPTGPVVNLEYAAPAGDSVSATYHVGVLTDIASFHNYGFYSFAGAAVSWLNAVPGEEAGFLPETYNGEMIVEITQPGTYTLAVHCSTISPAMGTTVDSDDPVVYPIQMSFSGIYPFFGVPIVPGAPGVVDYFVCGVDPPKTLTIPPVRISSFDLANNPHAGWHFNADLFGRTPFMLRGADVTLAVTLTRVA